MGVNSQSIGDDLDVFARAKLAELDASGLRRRLFESEWLDCTHVLKDGRVCLCFSSNDYHGLSRHPAVIEAAVAATLKWGTGAGATRTITGNHPLFRPLEQALAEYKGAEDCAVISGGYLANAGIVPALVGKSDLIVADELSHSSLLAGARQSGATIVLFRHNNVDDARRHLDERRNQYKHCLVITETVFSMDGDLGPVLELSQAARDQSAWLMTDDAHGLGVVRYGKSTRVPLQMGTLSKSLGSFGGYICGDSDVIELLRNRVRAFRFSTGLPPAVAASSLKALEILSTDPELAARPRERARLFCDAMGLAPPSSQIVPIILGTPERSQRVSRRLESAGFLVVEMRPPVVPPGTARIRVTFSAAHSESDVMQLASALKHVLAECITD